MLPVQLFIHMMGWARVAQVAAQQNHCYMLLMRQEDSSFRNQHLWDLPLLRSDAVAATLALLPGFASLYFYTSDLTMYVIGRSTLYVAHLLFSLIAANSALSTTSHVLERTTDSPSNATPGLHNETPMLLPKGIPRSPGDKTSQASVPYPVPGTAIALRFIHFGSQIPAVRALSTIRDARQQIRSHLAPNSEDARNNHMFEYPTRSVLPAPRVCFIVVQAYGPLGLSWSLLDQILEGLAQFSSEAGTDHQVHYQALEFEVNLADEGKIGMGLLWTTPSGGRGAAEISRSAEMPVAGQELDKRLNLVSELANETPSDMSKGSSLTSSSKAEVSFPVPGTNISLSFIWVGSPIPNQMVNEALQGASLKIAPFLKESSSEGVPHNRFLYSITIGRVQMEIQVYGMSQMTWSQVNSVVIGLSRFTNGIGTLHDQEHFRNLGFDVTDDSDGRRIGYGNLLAVASSGSIPVSAVDEKRSTLTSPPPINSTVLQLYNANNSSPSLSTSFPVPYIWPIHGTVFTLIFTYVGAPLPPTEVNAAIRNACRRINVAIRLLPDQPIAEEGFENHVGTVQVSVVPFEGSEISWWQLGEVLTGLAYFCAAPYKRLLVFEIEVEDRGKIGAGKLWHYVPDPEVGAVVKGGGGIS